MISNQSLLIFGLLLCHAASHGQSIAPSSLDAAGGSNTLGGNVYEYAIGQPIAANAFVSASLVVTPGVLQPAATTGVGTQAISAGLLQIFPGPVDTRLSLQPAFNGSGLLQYRLYDVAGRLILSNEAKLKSGTERQEVDMSAMAAGQYMLQVNWRQSDIDYTSGYKVQKLR